MLFHIIVFTVFISVANCNGECVTNEKCLESVEETNNTFTSTIIYYWQERLRLDEEITERIKKEVEKLNEDIKAGPAECSHDFILIETPERYSDQVQLNCFNDKYEIHIPEEVEEYFSGTYTGSFENFCSIYVDYLNTYCDYLANGIKQTSECNISNVFEELFKKPWLDCVYSNNNELI